MKNVQDELRKRQALIISAVITLLCVSVWVMFLYQTRLTQVSEGIETMADQMRIEFGNNEEIAGATSVRFQLIRQAGNCGSMAAFSQRDDNIWAINGSKTGLNPQYGALLSRTRDTESRCMYEAAEFIRHKINSLNPGMFDTHRYIIAHNGNWIYWFDPYDAEFFNFNHSTMLKDPTRFFTRPESFYDRQLRKDFLIKATSATNFYTDTITGDLAYSVVSYIYDFSGADASDKIVGYLLYDHSLTELQKELNRAFSGQLPPALMVELYNLPTNKVMCLTNSCHWQGAARIHQTADKYQLRYALPLYLFAIRDPAVSLVIVIGPLCFLLLAFSIRRKLNISDIKVYTDPLTGCFTRKIIEFVRKRADEYSVVILMDCNKFKAINDTWGHNTGDMALKIIAQRMMSNVREGVDLVIRSGGDEFVILLNRTPLSDARVIATRVAGQISAHDFINSGERVHLSVSWGVAVFEQDLDTTIQKADADMYRMKQARQEAPVTVR